MSLDWSLGFGSSLQNLPDDAPQGLRNICYFPPKGEDAEKYAIPMFMDPRFFVCAQIPGVLPRETFLVDLLSVHPETSLFIIDFISYERIFINDLKKLRDNVIENCGESTNGKVGSALTKQLTQLIRVHDALLADIENMANQGANDCVSTFVEKVTGNERIIETHRVYLDRFLQCERAAVALSREHSFSYRDVFDGRTIIQMLRSPIDWQKQAFAIARDLAKTLPAEVDRAKLEAQLEKFAAKVDEIIQMIDSVPTLEHIAKLMVKEPFPIVVQGRRLLKRGQAMKMCRKEDSAREIFLFSDIFVYAQMTGGRLLAPASYLLAHLEVAVKENNVKGLCCYAPKKSFVLLFNTVEERAAWEEDINRAIEPAREFADVDTPRDILAPIWIQDREEPGCMVCKSTFTLMNRRHHCRGCGRLLCKNCLKKKMFFASISQKRVVVCDDCFEKYSNRKL